MKVLYFIEPFYEIENPAYRIPTLRSILLPQILLLKKEDKQIEIEILLAKDTFDLLGLDEKFDWVKFICIDRSVYKDFTSQIDYAENTYLYNNDTRIENVVKRIREIYASTDPDVVVNYESSSGIVIRKLFKKARIFNMKFGPFSRPPFPATNYFSEDGIYKDSPILNIRPRDLSDKEKGLLKFIRRTVYKTYCENSNLRKFVFDLRRKYDRIVLLACQIDEYFAFTCNSKYKTQEELVTETAKRIPLDTCLLVSCHGEYEIQFKKKNFGENVVLVDTKQPYASQELAIYVDGIVTVSSSVGYFGALWRKPIYISGKSHLNVFSCKNIEEMLSKCYVGDDNDSILFDVLSKYTNFDKYSIFNAKWLLNRFKGKNNCNGKEPGQILEQFKNSYRGAKYKEQLKKANITTHIDWLGASIAKYKYISFDLFDTLINRPFIEPWHLFFVVEDRVRGILRDRSFPFVSFRRMAEGDLRRMSEGRYEITLDEIYKQFSELTGISGSDLDKIKEIEIETEIEFCRKRRGVSFYLKQANLLCNKVSIITDIYLPKYVIENILDKNEIEYSDLFVSSDLKYRKQNGTMFAYYLNYFGFDPKDAYHVGDNDVADYKMPMSYGINAGCIKRAINTYSKNKFGLKVKADINFCGISGSFYIGNVCNRWYDDPIGYVENSPFNGDSFEFGYKAIGPLVTGFCQWLHRQLQYENYKSIYFLARDGWLLKRAYDILFPDSRSKYLYCSRRSTSIPSIEDPEDVYPIAFQSFDARTLSSYLMARFGLDCNDVQVKGVLNKFGLDENTIITPLRHRKMLKQLLDQLYGIIQEKVKEERYCLLKYFDNIGLKSDVQNDNRVAFVDIGYSGTMQRCVSKIYKTNLIDGYYFLTHFFARNEHVGEKTIGFLDTDDDHRSALRHPLNDYVFLFETCFSSPEGSLIRLNSAGDKVFIEDSNEQNRISLLKNIHSGCLKYINDINRYCKDQTLEIPAKLSEFVLLDLASHPSKIDAQIFASIGVENVFGGGDACLICKGSSNPTAVEKDRLISQSKWKPGARAYYSDDVPVVRANSQAVVRNDATKKILKSKNDRLLDKLKDNPSLYYRDSNNVILNTLAYKLVKNHSDSLVAKSIIKMTSYFLSSK